MKKKVTKKVTFQPVDLTTIDPQDTSALLTVIASLQQQLAQSHALNEALQEQVAYYARFIFGKKSEKTQVINADQLSLFEDPDQDNTTEKEKAIEKKVEVKSFTRRPKGKKAEIIHSLPVTKVVDASNGKCQCQHCHQEMARIGVAKESLEIIVQPATVTSVKHIQSSFKCLTCSEKSEKDVIQKGPIKQLPLHGSLCSASLASQIIDDRYNYYLPYYRLEKKYNKMGIQIARNTMANWLIKLSDYYFNPIVERLKEELRKRKVLHGDETHYHVNKSKKETHYMWLLQTPEYDEEQIALLECHDSRAKTVFEEMIGNFKGHIHCDGYQAYYSMPSVTPVACWAHLRRKFIDAQSVSGPKSPIAQTAIDSINLLFRLEQGYKKDKVSNDARYLLRQKHSLIVYHEFKQWVDEVSLSVNSSSKLMKAFQYFYNHEAAFERVFEDGRFELSNNLAERTIRPVVMGRKNWMFSDSVAGSKANAVYHTLIATAKLNNLDPHKYFEYLLDHMPNDPDYLKKGYLDQYLPWSKEIQAQCLAEIKEKE